MPDESCRACGGTLIDFSQCAECKKIISLICKSCHRKTMEQFHSRCVGIREYDNQKSTLMANVSNFVIA
jgi:hypothetical protein